MELGSVSIGVSTGTTGVFVVLGVKSSPRRPSVSEVCNATGNAGGKTIVAGGVSAKVPFLHGFVASNRAFAGDKLTACVTSTSDDVSATFITISIGFPGATISVEAGLPLVLLHICLGL
jgi:hypothetical protein